MNRFLAFLLALLVADVAVAEGANAHQAIVHPPILTDGLYTMKADFRKPGRQHNYGGTNECRVKFPPFLTQVSKRRF